MKFLKAFYLTGSTSVLVTIVAFINNIVVTRFIGTEGRGKYSIVSNLIIILTLVLGEGLRRNNILVIGRKSKPIFEVFRKNSLVFVVITIFLFLIYFFLDNEFESIFKVKSTFILIAITSALMGILWKGVQAIFLGMQDYVNYNAVSLLYTMGIFVVNILVIYVFKADLITILFGFIIVASILLLFEFIKLYPKLLNDRNKDNNAQQDVVFKATIASIAGFVLLKGDIFILNYFSTSATTGIYSISKVFIDLFQKLPLVLGPIIIARSAAANANEEIHKVAKLSRVLVVVSIISVLVFYLIGDQVISILFTESFDKAYYYLLFILPSLIFYSSGHVLNAFLMGQGFPLIVIINSLFFALVNSVLNILLLPKYGVIVTPIICSITYGLWSIVFIIYIHKKYNINLLDMILMKIDDVKYIKSLVQ